jgi:hypothetical protein
VTGSGFSEDRLDRVEVARESVPHRTVLASAGLDFGKPMCDLELPLDAISD